MSSRSLKWWSGSGAPLTARSNMTWLHNGYTVHNVRCAVYSSAFTLASSLNCLFPFSKPAQPYLFTYKPYCWSRARTGASRKSGGADRWAGIAERGARVTAIGWVPLTLRSHAHGRQVEFLKPRRHIDHRQQLQLFYPAFLCLSVFYA